MHGLPGRPIVPRPAGGLRGMLRVFLPALVICLPVLMQPDKGGFGVMFVCACATMWIGGVDSSKVAVPFFALVSGALALTMSDPYSRNRLGMWLGDVSNEQVEQGLVRIAAQVLVAIKADLVLSRLVQ